MAAVSDLIDQLVKQNQALESGDATARNAMLDVAGKLTLALETPGDTLTRIGWGEPTRNVVIRVAQDLGLFEKLGDTDKSLDELAEGTGAEKELVARTLKHLAASGIIQEPAQDVYHATPFSSMVATPPMGAASVIYSFEGMAPSFQGLPSFLKKTGYRVPTDPIAGPFQYGHNTDKPFFGILQSNPRLGDAFNNFMTAYGQVRPRWTDYYPVVERLGGDLPAESDSVLLVDVGGGLGHDLLEFHSKFPQLPGKLILQDTPAVISTIATPLPDRMKATTHDFFTPQPVQGAKAYYMHLVLHDWPEPQAKKILTHLRDAMKPGFSRILINENVVPDFRAPWQMTSLDWVMMAQLANRERREGQWRELLEPLGLEILGIWRKDEGSESLIEVGLASK